MNLITRIQRKLSSLWEFYTFQILGIPKSKQERISKSVMRKFLPSKPVMIDCGAHDGYDSVELYKVLSGTVYSFEPVPDIYQRLKQRTSSYSSIRTFQLALSNENGKQSFYVSKGGSDASSSLLEPSAHLKDHPDTSFEEKLEVQTITLDKWGQENNVTHVDLLWLDMQGFELAMLKASETILSTVKVIHTEVSMKETYKGVPQYAEFRDYLISKGFSVEIEAIPTGWDMGNVLFIRK